MRQKRWKVRICSECINRMEVDMRQIETCIRGYLRRHAKTVHEHVYHVIHYSDRGSHWCIFSYIDPLLREVEAVDTAPVQTTAIGKKWFDLLDYHFRVFGMPWRLRDANKVHPTMVTAGQREVEKLTDDAEGFIKRVKMPLAQKRECRALLEFVDRAIENSHRNFKKGNIVAAIRDVDNAVYNIHMVLYMAGDMLNLI